MQSFNWETLYLILFYYKHFESDIAVFFSKTLVKYKTLINQKIITINKFISPFYFSQPRSRICLPVFLARLLFLFLLAFSHRFPETNSSCRGTLEKVPRDS